METIIDERIELDLSLANLRYSIAQLNNAIVKQKQSLSDWNVQQLEESLEDLYSLINIVK